MNGLTGPSLILLGRSNNKLFLGQVHVRNPKPEIRKLKFVFGVLKGFKKLKSVELERCGGLRLES